jgi:hypothetical protein
VVALWTGRSSPRSIAKNASKNSHPRKRIYDDRCLKSVVLGRARGLDGLKSER